MATLRHGRRTRVQDHGHAGAAHGQPHCKLARAHACALAGPWLQAGCAPASTSASRRVGRNLTGSRQLLQGAQLPQGQTQRTNTPAPSRATRAAKVPSWHVKSVHTARLPGSSRVGVPENTALTQHTQRAAPNTARLKMPRDGGRGGAGRVGYSHAGKASERTPPTRRRG